MKFGVVNKSTTVNKFVLHILQRNITHLAVRTRKTNKKLGILKGGNWKRAAWCYTVQYKEQICSQLSICSPRQISSHYDNVK